MRRWGRKEDAAHFANVRKVLAEGKKNKIKVWTEGIAET